MISRQRRLLLWLLLCLASSPAMAASLHRAACFFQLENLLAAWPGATAIQPTAAGNWLLTLAAEGRLLEINPAGVEQWKLEGLRHPTLAIRQETETLVVFQEEGAVRAYGPTGQLLHEATGLSRPAWVQVLSNGNWLITNTGKNEILELDPNTGTPIWSSLPFALKAPRKALLTADQGIAIVEFDRHRIVFLSRERVQLKEFVGFDHPSDLLETASGWMILDRDRQRLALCGLDATCSTYLELPAKRPLALALSQEGKLYVLFEQAPQRWDWYLSGFRNTIRYYGGLVLLGAALLGFATLVLTRGLPRPEQRALALLLLAALLFLCGQDLVSRSEVWIVCLAFLGGTALLSGLAGRRFPELPEPPAASVFTRSDWLLGLLLLGLTLFVRLWRLTDLPIGINNDESLNGFLGIRVLEGIPFTPKAAEREYLLYYLVAFLFKAFGASLFTLRMVGVLSGVVSVLAVCGIARRLWGRRIGWYAALFAVCSPMDLAYGRTGHVPLLSNLLFMPGVYFLLVAWSSGKARWFTLSGALLGLSVSTFYNSKFLAPIVVALGAPAVLFLLPSAAWRRRIAGSACLAISFALASFPTLSYILTQPGKALSREQSLIFRSPDNHDGTPLQIAAKNVGSAYAFLFKKYVDGMLPTYPGAIFIEPGNLLIFVAFFLFAAARPGPRFWLLAAWFLIGLIPALLTDTAPRRLLLILPPAYILGGALVDWLARCLAGAMHLPRRWAAPILGVALAGLQAWYSFDAYFLKDSSGGHGNLQALPQRLLAEYIAPRCGQESFLLSKTIPNHSVYFVLLYGTTQNNSLLGKPPWLRRPNSFCYQAAPLAEARRFWNGTDPLTLADIGRHEQGSALWQAATSLDPQATLEVHADPRWPNINFTTATVRPRPPG